MHKSTKESIDNIDQILNQMSADHPGDVIADILHWCDHYGEDFVNLVERAQLYHEDETEDEDWDGQPDELTELMDFDADC